MRKTYDIITRRRGSDYPHVFYCAAADDQSVAGAVSERYTAFMPAYLLLNLYFTLLMREPGEDYPIILTPLRSYFAVLGWDVQSFPVVGQLLQGSWEEPIAFAFESLIGIVQNLILFMPFGFLLCGATDQPRTSRILLLGFLLSLSIELCQLLFRLGWFEIDDILHNVLGTYLGIRLYRRTVKRTST